MWINDSDINSHFNHLENLPLNNLPAVEFYKIKSTESHMIVCSVLPFYMQENSNIINTQVIVH